MDDDFNTADAISAVFELVKLANSNSSETDTKAYITALKESIVKLADILGLNVVKEEELLDEDVEALINERQQARKDRNFARADEIRDELIKFIQKMWSNNLILENGTNGTNTIEKEMITYIRQNFTREISLKEFGAQFHLSEKYISRYFKEHFHITLSQYINHLRLEHARQLLEESATSVTEVAMCSGYQNVSYFIRSFKKMYGVSPLKYRKASCII